MPSSDAEIIAAIDAAFGPIAKPAHFTDYTHCDECREHDETLGSHDRNTLPLNCMNNPGWDPLCFTSAQGIAYYMPTLARFAFAPGPSFYGDQLLFHLYSGGQYNSFLQFCDRAQRKAVAAFIEHLILTRPDDISAVDHALAAEERWRLT